MKSSNLLFFALFLFILSSCAKEEVTPTESVVRIEGKKANPPNPTRTFLFESEPIALTLPELFLLNTRMHNLNSFALISNCEVFDYVDFNPNDNIKLTQSTIDPDLTYFQIVDVEYIYYGNPNNQTNDPVWTAFGGNIEVRTSPQTYSNCPLIEFEFSNNTWQIDMEFNINLVPIYQGGSCPINC